MRSTDLNITPHSDAMSGGSVDSDAYEKVEEGTSYRNVGERGIQRRDVRGVGDAYEKVEEGTYYRNVGEGGIKIKRSLTTEMWAREV